MINWLMNYQGRNSIFDISAEKFELQELRKEMRKYEKKYNLKQEDDEMHVETEESQHSEEEDVVDNLLEQRKQKAAQKGGRSSVSAEVYGQFNVKQAFVPKHIIKTPDQIKRIQEKVLKSFIFNSLDEKELKIVIDAMEEYTCKKGDYVITQGDPGAVLYIIESGTYDCYKQFVSIALNLLNLIMQNPQDGPIKVKEYFPGDSFGELALLYNAPRAASIVAKEEGIAWTLDRETFNNIVKEAAMKKRDKYEAFLKSVDILKQIEAYELSQICDALKTKKVKAGETIIKQGDIGDDFYIVEEGEAYAEKLFEGQSASQKVLDYSKGGYFGELALLRNEPRAASVIATTDCNLLCLERKAFKRLLGPIENILKRSSEAYIKFVNN